ncbi:MAG: T9SS type A sorting domain-containing protein [Mucilaginibacter sp.]
MYPNPTSGLFTMDMNASSQLIITNTLGQEILNERKEAGKQIIDIRNHPDGVYFVKVLSENRQQVFKLVKE